MSGGPCPPEIVKPRSSFPAVFFCYPLGSPAFRQSGHVFPGAGGSRVLACLPVRRLNQLHAVSVRIEQVDQQASCNWARRGATGSDKALYPSAVILA